MMAAKLLQIVKSNWFSQLGPGTSIFMYKDVTNNEVHLWGACDVLYTMPSHLTALYQKKNQTIPIVPIPLLQ